MKHRAEIASPSGSSNILFDGLVNLPAHKLLGSLLQITEQHLDQMQVFVSQRARDLEHSHVVLHEVVVELRGEL